MMRVLKGTMLKRKESFCRHEGVDVHSWPISAIDCIGGLDMGPDRRSRSNQIINHRLDVNVLVNS